MQDHPAISIPHVFTMPPQCSVCTARTCMLEARPFATAVFRRGSLVVSSQSMGGRAISRLTNT